MAAEGDCASAPLQSPFRWSASPVPSIAPCQGWTLLWCDEEDGDGFTTPLYIARGPDHDVRLDHSRFSFTPTQARFDWFVRNGFPRRRGIGPWDDHDVDLEIARERLLALTECAA